MLRTNAGGFGDVEKVKRDFMENDIAPKGQLCDDLYKWTHARVAPCTRPTGWLKNDHPKALRSWRARSSPLLACALPPSLLMQVTQTLLGPLVGALGVDVRAGCLDAD
jgi:hypothetical protein